MSDRDARRRRMVFGTPADAGHKAVQQHAAAWGWTQVCKGPPSGWVREGRLVLVYVEGKPRRPRLRHRVHADLAAPAGVGVWRWAAGRLEPLAVGIGEVPFGPGAPAPSGVALLTGERKQAGAG